MERNKRTPLKIPMRLSLFRGIFEIHLSQEIDKDRLRSFALVTCKGDWTIRRIDG